MIGIMDQHDVPCPDGWKKLYIDYFKELNDSTCCSFCQFFLKGLDQ